MTKLLKNTKCLLSCVLAFAVIAVSLFTGVVINADAACGENVIYYDGKAASQPTQTDDKGNILITTANELRWLVQNSSSADPAKTYKVADGIDAIVLQKESNVKKIGGFAALKSATSAQVKEWFSGDGWSKWWSPKKGGFNATFDGNGVTIYGIQTYGDAYTALFHEVQGNVTIKNVNVAKSYMVAKTSAAGIVAHHKSESINTINIENCSVTDCYIESTGTGSGEIFGAGAILGREDNKNGSFNINNCFVKLDDSCLVSTTSKADSVAIRSGLVAYANTNKGTFKNCVVIGVTPYALNSSATDNHKNTAFPSHFENVYTDKASGLVDLGGKNLGEQDFTDKIFQLTDAQMKGAAAVENMDLDWSSVWIVAAEDYPVLRVSHKNVTIVNNNDGTHSEKCSCGFAAIAENHKWVDNTCTVCNFVCTHTRQTVNEFRAGNCVTKDGYYTECRDCPWSSVVYVGTVAGHKLTWVEEVYADCEKTGREGYYHCEVCGGNFQADSEEVAKWADMDTNIEDPDTALITPVAPHNATNRADGKVLVFSDETGHWWVCYTCDGRLEAIEDKDLAEEGKVKKHKYDDSVCIDCGWECTEHNYQATGTVAVAGSCTVDREEEIKCTICGDKKSVVTAKAGHKIVKVEEVAATERLEGTKAHYKCSVCQEIYTDAEGKTKATATDLVIAKTLPAEYQNVPIGGTINTDTSNKSPSTGDSLASVMAVAMLAGVAFVALRKVR